VTLLALIAVALGGGVATILIAPDSRRAAAGVGLAFAVAATTIAIALPIGDGIATGGAALTSSGLIRLFAIGWAAGTIGLALLELPGRRRVVSGPALLGLGAAILALAVHDPATGFAALGGGGLAAILLPGLAGWRGAGGDPAHLPTVVRGTWATIGSALLGIAVIAWAASPVGPLANGPPVGDPELQAAASLALLGIVVAVGIRAGLIPAHVWAARFSEGVSPLAVPAALAWGPAAFMLVALDWAQVAVGPVQTAGVEQVLILVVGISSIVVGGFAAMLHDDLEHILGYSILQDAGVAVLAFGALHSGAPDGARDWLVATAATKTALAAWVSVMRTTFGAHRLGELSGWARASPALAVSFGIIFVAAVGLPAMSVFDARMALIDGALPGPAGLALLIVAFTPIVYLGRVGLTGMAAMSAVVEAAPSARLRWTGGREPGWTRRPAIGLIKAIPAEIRANRPALTALAVVALAVLGLVIAAVGVGV
jgi:formate hydrogenlyase subunit 3/multisubunit Na+/H+ antiporter MnhD subunit